MLDGGTRTHTETLNDASTNGNRKPFRCGRCKEVVAETDGASIFFGIKPVPLEPLRIKFICPHCRAEVEWFSLRRKKPIA